MLNQVVSKVKKIPLGWFYHPDEFAVFTEEGTALGFSHVEAVPLARSSYHAEQQTSPVN